MSDPVPLGTGWSTEAVRRFVSLAEEGATAEVISLKLQRPLPDIRAKAAELGLSLKAA
ncbi:hypothetical protein [Methylobrevis albus]|uniref:Uncharacterized protein n=1 Tax=Methylobrevis albus TaxID=2793297 RepID=A0A931I001_9HYPH|nr:hypothetical protein [Methylobrevis albus]MBH0236834.1 hypothetical protein [Methylobrevis albus]